MKIDDLRSKGMSLKPTIMIGKAGFTDSVLEELKGQLENRELVKVKFQRSMGPSSGWKEELEGRIEGMKATLVEIKGSTALIYKRSSKKDNQRSKAR